MRVVRMWLGGSVFEGLGSLPQPAASASASAASASGSFSLSSWSEALVDASRSSPLGLDPSTWLLLCSSVACNSTANLELPAEGPGGARAQPLIPPWGRPGSMPRGLVVGMQA
jgi:hypothetical protein